jgi:tryptophan halogenase
MVFNRNITDIDEAKEYFVKYWNNRIPVEKVRAINWDPYYIEDQWSGNVVNIGLSAGFIEPLESTGIGLITAGITQLSNTIKDRHYADIDRLNFNVQMTIVFEDAVDFVSAHYANNKRTSKFWNYVKDTFVPSDKMLHQIEELKNPNVEVPYNGKLHCFFNGCNWTLLSQQLGYEITPRNLPIDKELAAEMLVGNYIEFEKNRHVWGRHHSAEVDRVAELRNFYDNN